MENKGLNLSEIDDAQDLPVHQFLILSEFTSDQSAAAWLPAGALSASPSGSSARENWVS